MPHDERFEHAHGPLRPNVQRVVEQYLDCGRLHGGFARLRCPSCRGEHLLVFSRQTRNFCPSCQAKRGALLAERLAEEILAPVPHRHVVFTAGKVIRGLFERERRLLSILPRKGQRELFLDELEPIGRLCAQIPDPRQHMVRDCSHYANRARGARGRPMSRSRPPWMTLPSSVCDAGAGPAC